MEKMMKKTKIILFLATVLGIQNSFAAGIGLNNQTKNTIIGFIFYNNKTSKGIIIPPQSTGWFDSGLHDIQKSLWFTEGKTYQAHTPVKTLEIEAFLTIYPNSKIDNIKETVVLYVSKIIK